MTGSDSLLQRWDQSNSLDELRTEWCLFQLDAPYKLHTPQRTDS